MYFGYNTNGLAHHRLASAITLLADLGYQGVAITIDHAALDPYSPSQADELAAIKEQLAGHSMKTVIETGARYLLDAKRKHFPTLLTQSAEDRQRRIDFLKRCIDIASALNSDCVSLWSGIADESSDESTNWQRLVEGLGEVLDHAAKRDVLLGFEPEPGMFIDTMARFDQLSERVEHPAFQLTLDLGHLHCQGEVPITEYVARYRDRILNIHIEDMRHGVHEHLMFGDGEMDFAPIIDQLRRIDYTHGIYVELSRHSHMGPAAAIRAMDFLSQL